MKRPDKPAGSLSQRLAFVIFLGGTAKFLVDVTVQFYNPFLAVVAAGMGIGVVAMGRIVALRNLTGLIAPFLGTLADRVGHKTIMRSSLLILGISMILAPLTGSLLIFAIAVIIAGVGQSGYTPNLHAYLSAKLPYEKRAMGLGIIEYSWAIAGIVGLFASGFLIEIFSWKAPFYFLGAGLIIMSFILGLLPNAEKPNEAKKGMQLARKAMSIADRLRLFFRLGPHARSAWAAIAVAGLNMFAMMHIMIIHGAWLFEEYGLSPAALGSVALAFGLADLAASVSVSIGVDRIGKRRSVMIGVAGMVFGYAVLPFLNISLVFAVISIIIPRMCFEFAVVSNIPLLSEQVPKSRGKVMSLGMAAGLLGATLAGLTGPLAYTRFGVWGLGWVSSGAALCSLVLLIAVVKEPFAALKSGRGT